MRGPTLVLLSAALLASCQFDPATRTEPSVQRHRVARGTDLVPAGLFQVEGGLEQDPGDGLDVGVGLRWGASPQTEFFALAEPLRRRSDVDANGAGDLLAGVRHRLWSEQENLPAVAVEFAAKLPVADADRGLGSGETDLFLGLSGERADVQGMRGIGFAQLGFLGDPSGDGTDLSLLVSGALERPVDTRTTLFAEVTGQHVGERDLALLYLSGGALLALNPHTVFDAGLSLGLGDDAESLRILVGLTHSLGRARSLRPRP